MKIKLMENEFLGSLQTLEAAEKYMQLVTGGFSLLFRCDEEFRSKISLACSVSKNIRIILQQRNVPIYRIPSFIS